MTSINVGDSGGGAGSEALGLLSTLSDPKAAAAKLKQIVDATKASRAAATEAVIARAALADKEAEIEHRENELAQGLASGTARELDVTAREEQLAKDRETFERESTAHTKTITEQSASLNETARVQEGERNALEARTSEVGRMGVEAREWAERMQALHAQLKAWVKDAEL